uniref:Putative Na+ channel toxin n=1 Tax=Superstitionia donensis TaxID=311983 RepID=A0A1V1WBP6_9SCOR
MGKVALRIVGIIIIFHIDRIFSYEGGYPVLINGADLYYGCSPSNDYCNKLCLAMDAGEGYCYIDNCFCKGLHVSKHAAYPKTDGGDYIWCYDNRQNNRYCEQVCKRYKGGPGICALNYHVCYCWDPVLEMGEFTIPESLYE